MPHSLRQLVRVRYHFCCGYCGVSETNIGAKMTVDHFLPRSLGGDNSPDNLVYCCHACNEFKNEYWQTEPDLRLIHPLLDEPTEHCREQEEGTILALTDRGANHIQILHLNRPELIAHRLEQQDIRVVREQNQRMRQFLLEAQERTRLLENALERDNKQ